MVAADDFAASFLRPPFEDSKIAAGVRPSEFIVEGRRAQRRRNHDIERRGNSVRLAEVGFPLLNHAGNLEIRHRIAGQAGFGLGAYAGGSLVANFAAPRPSRPPGKGEMAVG